MNDGDTGVVCGVCGTIILRLSEVLDRFGSVAGGLNLVGIL